MKKTLTLLTIGMSLISAARAADEAIDRKAVVGRHDIITTAWDTQSPAQVGNGEFALAMDMTGLQSFIPFNTMSQWSWHSFPVPEGLSIDDYRGLVIETHGRPVWYNAPDPDNPEISHWLAGNPHRFNLGRTGFRFFHRDGTQGSMDELTDLRQTTDLWNGNVESRFCFDGVPVTVVTVCDPDQDRIAVKVESELLRQGRIDVFFRYPYPRPEEFQDYLGDYHSPDRHTSRLLTSGQGSAVIERTMDSTRYFSDIACSGGKINPEPDDPHTFILTPAPESGFSFSFGYSLEEAVPIRTGFGEICEASTRAWNGYWLSGGVIDLSESTDPRWMELERRIVLSQYLMRVNEAGSLPPQESGLVNNGWHGRLHFEMIWWHGVHYALWGRWELFDRSLGIFRDFLPTSRQRAAKMGRSGAKWPKCTADMDRDWPHIIHGTLIWQQPHPIYFAELEYRLDPSRQTLEKWSDIIFETADYMADYAHYDTAGGRYVLGPPLVLVSENTDYTVTQNPSFELSYWRYGLRKAGQWRQRKGLEPVPRWDEVLENLAELPVDRTGCYVTYEGIPDMWGSYNFEHPALTGIYGMLPGDGVDPETFQRTLDKVTDVWRMDAVWGWDFPMMAMAAARTLRPELAVDLLMWDSDRFGFDVHGLAVGGPFPYFPSNGGLLTAVAMMAAGWDGSEGHAPGFPAEGWKVKWEGLNKMQ